jgi:large subunit ribosomal protein L10
MSTIANNSANRVGKEKAVTTIGGDVQDAGIVVVTTQVGLNADETRNLRVSFLKEKVDFKVGKNTLVKLALKGTKFEGLTSLLRGPTALAYSKDPIAAAKVAVEFAKKNKKLKIVGAAMGDKILSEAETNTLASLPSLDQLRGKIIGLLQAPATKIAGILQAPAGQLARVLSAKSRQG